MLSWSKSRTPQPEPRGSWLAPNTCSSYEDRRGCWGKGAEEVGVRMFARGGGDFGRIVGAGGGREIVNYVISPRGYC
jgi:hypothetical protein